MIQRNQDNNGTDRMAMENFTVRLTDPMLYDRMNTLATEYSVSVELLVGEAVKRLLADVDFVRELRAGKTGPE